MSDKPAFSIDLGGLKSRAKEHTPQAVEKIDRAGEAHGFVDRSPKKKRGRQPSPRTGQVGDRIRSEAPRRAAGRADRRSLGALLQSAWPVRPCAIGGGATLGAAGNVVVGARGETELRILFQFSSTPRLQQSLQRGLERSMKDLSRVYPTP